MITKCASPNRNTKIRPLSLETPLWQKLCLLLSSHQQPLLERFLNRAAEGFQNLFTAVEDHFELCLAKCRTSSLVSVTHSLCRFIAASSLFVAFQTRIHENTLLLSCFRASNMKTPTGTRRRNTATARVHQNFCRYDSVFELFSSEPTSNIEEDFLEVFSGVPMGQNEQ